jgi:hypothetical protein
MAIQGPLLASLNNYDTVESYLNLKLPTLCCSFYKRQIHSSRLYGFVSILKYSILYESTKTLESNPSFLMSVFHFLKRALQISQKGAQPRPASCSLCCITVRK